MRNPESIAEKPVVGRHKAIFLNPPMRVPSNKHLDGPLLGNGDVGVVLCGPPERLRFMISKNDFWKSKAGFPNGGPRPIGGLDLVVPSLHDASYHVEVDLLKGELSGTFSNNEASLEIRAYVLATENVLIVEVTVTSGSATIDRNLWVHSGDESTSNQSIFDKSTTDSSLSSDWITRSYEGFHLAWPCQAAVALKQLSCIREGNRLQAGERIRFVAAVCSSFDAPHPLVEATRCVEELSEQKLEQLWDEHRDWWSDFWGESLVSIHDEVIERHYYGAQYLLACCCRNPDFPPGLWGNWLTTDTPAWAGDYHLNYNHQAPFWGLYSSNHLRLADCYHAPLLDYIEAGKRSAKDFLGTRGVYYDVGIGPRGFCSSLFSVNDTDSGSIRAAELDHGHQFWGQKSNAVFGAVPMLLRWQHSLDVEYARRVYPYLIEVANFWEDYLVFEAGRYVIYNDAFNEAGPWEGEGWEELRKDFNPVISLGCVRMLFQALIQISSALERDWERLGKWQHILQHLSEFPLVKRHGTLLPQGAETGPSSHKIGTSRLIFHGTIWPCSVVGQGQRPEYFKILREGASAWSEEVWVQNGNAFDTVPQGAARLLIEPEHILEMMRRKIKAHALPNLLIEQSGGGIETCGGITAGINEMLLQSYEGILRLFPNWPLNHDARFERLRSWGAFLVSAELKGGQIEGVRIISEQGQDCHLINPWPENAVQIIRHGREAEVLSDERLIFKTSLNEEIQIKKLNSIDVNSNTYNYNN